MSTGTQIVEQLNNSPVMVKLAELRKQQTDLGKKLKDEAKAAFHAHVGVLFEALPKLVAFSWTQYTPYFNDGDPCEFGARTDDFKIQYGEDEDLDTFYFSDTKYVKTGRHTVRDWRGNMVEQGKYEHVKWEHTPEEIEKNDAYEAIGSFLQNFDEDSLLFMFGDHAEITVTKKGVSVDEYGHD